jgi:hypothetical protein
MCLVLVILIFNVPIVQIILLYIKTIRLKIHCIKYYNYFIIINIIYMYI